MTDHTVLPGQQGAHYAWWFLHGQGHLSETGSCALCRAWEQRWIRNQRRDHAAIFQRRQERAVEAGFKSYYHQRRAVQLGLSPDLYAEYSAMDMVLP